MRTEADCSIKEKREERHILYFHCVRCNQITHKIMRLVTIVIIGTHADSQDWSVCEWEVTLRKHAYSNILKISPPKKENFEIKNSDTFHSSAQNIDCGYSLEPPQRGGSNEYPQSMFLNINKKINVYPCKPQFYYIKVGFKRVKII